MEVAAIFAEAAEDVLGSLRPERLRRAWRDGWTGLAFALGLAGLCFDPGVAPPLWRVAFTALTEELTYRVLLQSQLERLVPGELRLSCARHTLSRGGLLASVLFALSHLAAQPPLMALLTFFPSVAFAVLWTRHRSLWLCAGLHFWYNGLFFYG